MPQARSGGSRSTSGSKATSRRSSQALGWRFVRGREACSLWGAGDAFQRWAGWWFETGEQRTINGR
jgi:hypothetical protein